MSLELNVILGKVTVELQVDLAAQELKAIQTFTRRLEEQFGNRIISIILFGSRTRAEAQPDSDMDIAVIVDQDELELRKAIRYIAAEISLEHGFYLSTRVWSQAHWDQLAQLQTGLYRNLLQDGIKVL
ncbi:MAG: hypothetical protein Fur0044_50260 [Anaerolineae bacterium]